MKTFMAACRFWFAPMSMLPMIALSVTQGNWLAAGAGALALMWAVAYTLSNAMLEVALERMREVLEFLYKLKEELRSVK